MVLDVVVIFLRYAHQHSAILSERTALFWLVKHITPHLLSGTIPNLNFALFNLILDEEVPSLDVLGLLR